MKLLFMQCCSKQANNALLNFPLYSIFHVSSIPIQRKAKANTSISLFYSHATALATNLSYFPSFGEQTFVKRKKRENKIR